MTLIVEAGATKSDWCLVGPKGELSTIQTGGINVSSMPKTAVEAVLREAYARLDISPSAIKKVHFYAAGMLGNEMAEYFPYSYVECASDTLAAARALFGRESGVAAILGTGSNCCLYDGDRIVKTVPSGGFILGDEGGSAVLGKRFLADFLKGLMPDTLAAEFASTFKVDYPTVVANVYRNATAVTYLGSFAPWITGHIGDSEYVRNLVEDNFRDFFRRSLSRFPGHDIGIVGGYAYALRDVIAGIASESGMRLTEILASPMGRLVDFHRNQAV